MDQHTWDLIDQEAEKEAEALRKARKFRSFSCKTASQKGVMSRDQAIWDEGLEIHFSHCSFCGKSLDLSEQLNPGAPIAKHHRVSLFTKDIDICDACMYLHQQLVRSCPIRSED